MSKFRNWMRSRVQVRDDEKAQGYVEYILIIALVGLATTVALAAFQGNIATALSTIGSALTAD